MNQKFVCVVEWDWLNFEKKFSFRVKDSFAEKMKSNLLTENSQIKTTDFKFGQIRAIN